MIIGSNTVASTYEPPAGPVWPDDPVALLGSKLLWLFDYNEAVVVDGHIASILDSKGGVLTIEDTDPAKHPAAVSEAINGVTQQFGRSTLHTHGLCTSTTEAAAPLRDTGAELFVIHREGSPITLGTGSSSNVTGAIVSSMTFAASNVSAFGFHTVSSQSQRIVRIARQTGSPLLRGSATTGFAYVANEWCCSRIRVDFTGSGIQIYRNGVFLVNGSILASSYVGTVFGLGFGYNGGPRSGGAGTASAPLDIAYAFLTTPNLTTQELRDLSTYVSERFGVASYV